MAKNHFLISLIPQGCGVYLMKDNLNNVIYIGKAKSLKKRLSSYFKNGLNPKTSALMSCVCDIEYRLCPTEAIALLLERKLIKQYRPKYNVSLRDDKNFPFVKITYEEFPVIYITRRKEEDRAMYFGPYTNVKLLKQVLVIIRRCIPYRSCKRLRQKACIYYRLRFCPCPCVGKISKEGYTKNIENIRLILEGNTDELARRLSEEMDLKSKTQRFEEAAKIRDQIEALAVMTEGSGSFSSKNGLWDLKSLLQLKKIPYGIEAFDISNISGKEAVGSMVSFYKGLPDKSSYRRFRIKTVQSINDYKMLAEIIRRRYARLIREGGVFPGLVLIDGGRSHLLFTQKELKKLGLDIPLVSIAKRQENIYIINKENAGKSKAAVIRLNANTPALNLIRYIRDEAHRFALRYHHILRRKKIIGNSTAAHNYLDTCSL
ncbi:MAG: excinuclease ABC subunit UvrC [Candidatus Omnitrophota bacterium]|nr:excinuclease ABC subunit UvrC [Candidatus Omnitrophota bacterium]